MEFDLQLVGPVCEISAAFGQRPVYMMTADCIIVMEWVIQMVTGNVQPLGPARNISHKIYPKIYRPHCLVMHFSGHQALRVWHGILHCTALYEIQHERSRDRGVGHVMIRPSIPPRFVCVRYFLLIFGTFGALALHRVHRAGRVHCGGSWSSDGVESNRPVRFLLTFASATFNGSWLNKVVSAPMKRGVARVEIGNAAVKTLRECGEFI